MSPQSPVRILTLGCGELIDHLAAAGYESLNFESDQQLLNGAKAAKARACLIHAQFEDPQGIALLAKRLRKKMPFTDVIAWAPESDTEEVRWLLKSGVQDVVTDGSLTTLTGRLREIIEHQTYLPRLLSVRSSIDSKSQFEGILSRNHRMKEIFEICAQAAATDATVLILGDTGTGKELIARAFHRRSGRIGRLVALNCAAVPENLIDSELFGHVRGAFTGAETEKPGLFRYAEGGTLFLDEIGQIPMQVQYRLLRVLQENKIRPVGGDKEIPIDVRVIAATSTRLDEAVQDEGFREDLLYRLDVIRIIVPTLKERPEDIIFLFGHFLKKLSKHYNLPRPEIQACFLDALERYSWPGNVRQLENFTERLLLTQQGNKKLTEHHFQQLVQPLNQVQAQSDTSSRKFIESRDRRPLEVDLNVPLKQAVEDSRIQLEKQYVHAALQKHRGRVGQAAKELHISRRTLLRKMTEFGIEKREFRGEGTPQIT